MKTSWIPDHYKLESLFALSATENEKKGIHVRREKKNKTNSQDS
jgi:hypothetical protein